MAEGVFDEAIHPRWCAEFFADPRHHLVVAMEGALVVGMATGVTYVHPDKATELWVNEVGMGSAYRGRGIGKRVLQALLDHGRALGCSEAWLGTEEENVAARALYRSAGATEHPMVYVTFDLS